MYFTPEWVGPSGHAVQTALAKGAPHVYVQQGAHQGGYSDEQKLAADIDRYAR